MDSRRGYLVASIVVSCFLGTCYGVTFSSLSRTLVVSTSTQPGQVLKAGEGTIDLTWSFNESSPPGTDSAYKTIKVKLCYAPISQRDRAWRKAADDLAKDKTCQHNIVARLYSTSNNSFAWTVTKDIPSATYFVRAYAFDSSNEYVAYGQTTNDDKKTDLFSVEGISGRHASLDAASICSPLCLCSAFFCWKSARRRGPPRLSDVMYLKL